MDRPSDFDNAFETVCLCARLRNMSHHARPKPSRDGHEAVCAFEMAVTSH